MARFLFRSLKGYRLLIVVAIALTFAQVGASLLVAFPLKFILDKLINHRDPHFPLAGIVLGVFDQLAPSPDGHHSAIAVILFATSLLVVLGLLSAGASFVQLYFAASIGQNLSARLRQKLFDHLQHLSLSWHGQQKTGDLVQRLVANVADIEKLVTDGLVDMLSSILTLVGMVLVLFLVNWQFTLLSLLVVPALFGVVLVYTRSIKAPRAERRRRQGAWPRWRPKTSRPSPRSKPSRWRSARRGASASAWPHSGRPVCAPGPCRRNSPRWWCC